MKPLHNPLGETAHTPIVLTVALFLFGGELRLVETDIKPPSGFGGFDEDDLDWAEIHMMAGLVKVILHSIKKGCTSWKNELHICAHAIYPTPLGQLFCRIRSRIRLSPQPETLLYLMFYSVTTPCT